MVHSGLQPGMLDVASYRLATHLGLAFAIVGLAYVYAQHFARREADLMQARRGANASLRTASNILMIMAFIQIILGALVAGIDAGRAFPTWPSMGGGFFPPEPFTLTPVWRNFFEDAGLVQFMHRMWGYALAIYAIVVWQQARGSGNGKTRFAFNVVLALMALQILIGIVTVLYQAQVHVAITHQLIGVLLWLAILRARFLTRFPLPQSVRDTA